MIKTATAEQSDCGNLIHGELETLLVFVHQIEQRGSLLLKNLCMIKQNWFSNGISALRTAPKQDITVPEINKLIKDIDVKKRNKR